MAVIIVVLLAVSVSLIVSSGTQQVAGVADSRLDTTSPTLEAFTINPGSAIIDWNVSDTDGSHLDHIEVCWHLMLMAVLAPGVS